MIFFWITVALGTGAIVAFIAREKGRSPMLWGFYGSVVPILALPHVLIARPVNDEAWSPVRFGIPEPEHPCPHCGAIVRGEAIVCRHCHKPLYEALGSMPGGEATGGSAEPDSAAHAKKKPVNEGELKWLDETFSKFSVDRVDEQRGEAGEIRADPYARVTDPEPDEERLNTPREPVMAERVRRAAMRGEPVPPEIAEAAHAAQSAQGRREADGLKEEALKAAAHEAERLKTEALTAAAAEAERLKAQALEATAIEAERLKQEALRVETLRAEVQDAERLKAEALRAAAEEAARLKDEALKAAAQEAARLKEEALKAAALEAARLKHEALQAAAAEAEARDIARRTEEARKEEARKTERVEPKLVVDHAPTARTDLMIGPDERLRGAHDAAGRPALKVEPGMRLVADAEPRRPHGHHRHEERTRAPLSVDDRSRPATAPQKRNVRKIAALAAAAAVVGFVVPWAAQYLPVGADRERATAVPPPALMPPQSDTQTAAAPPPDAATTPPSGAAPDEQNTAAAPAEPPAETAPPATAKPDEGQEVATARLAKPVPQPRRESVAPPPDVVQPFQAPKSEPATKDAPARLEPPVKATPKAAPKATAKARPRPQPQEDFMTMVGRALGGGSVRASERRTDDSDAVDGAAGQLVQTVQEKLRDRGFDPGTIDGRTGPKTVQAIRAYQQSIGMKADGKIDMALMERLGIVGQQLHVFGR